MAGATFDMWTSGENAGQLKRPLAYTTDEDEATRVKVYCQLATPVGKYLLKTSEGLDHERILQADCSDEERSALVRAVILSDERVASVVTGPTVTVDLDGVNGPTVTIYAVFQTITGALVSIGG